MLTPIYPNLFIEYTFKECFVFFQGYGIPKGCGQWVRNVTPDNTPICIEDEERLFQSQTVHGFRFSETKFVGLKLSTLVL
jgi:hypothetical protein